MTRLFTELNEQVDYAVQLFAQGIPKKVIAAIMFKSPNTVTVQINEAYKTLGINSQSDLIYIYIERTTGMKLQKSEDELTKEYRRSLHIPKVSIQHLAIVALFFSISLFDVSASTYTMRRPNTRNNNRIEARIRSRKTKQGREINLTPLFV